MSFKNQNFSVLAYANGFTLWNYNTEDALADVKTAGYFNEIASFARVGDMILTVANKENAVVPAIFIISAINSGVVAATDFTSAQV
ncbi:MAG: hypothetical protein LBR70_05160 [Lactobacillaceae bacterium]|jgi:hypothetical protein|nr:hypothetical protein [Lactobacillaceae bacterium]